MSDGNPELLPTSQVSAPPPQGGLSLGLVEPRCGWHRGRRAAVARVVGRGLMLFSQLAPYEGPSGQDCGAGCE